MSNLYSSSGCKTSILTRDFLDQEKVYYYIALWTLQTAFYTTSCISDFLCPHMLLYIMSACRHHGNLHGMQTGGQLCLSQTKEPPLFETFSWLTWKTSQTSIRPPAVWLERAVKNAINPWMHFIFNVFPMNLKLSQVSVPHHQENITSQ